MGSDQRGDSYCRGCANNEDCQHDEARRKLTNRVYACNTSAGSIKVTQLALSGDGRHTNGCKGQESIKPRPYRR